MEPIRSFIAIELPHEIRLALETLQARLKSPDQPWVKWVDPHGIHLTLKFLGNVATDRIDEIIAAMREAAGGMPTLHLELKGIGVFPNLKRVQVVWVGLDGEIEQLRQLQQRIEASLSRLGFARESRPFTPHLTLARVRDRASAEERQAFGQVVASASLEADYAFEVKAIILIKSQLTRTGAVYSQLGAVGLKKPLSTTQT
ncbi:MAG TPA: RNA 2',3'-cyclic phosphodiesterase [Dehalococcoidia bacterium]|nr:RNA 2',3'-cyclic phosphodiesterase [Dehalococcoidia bacterium]